MASRTQTFSVKIAKVRNSSEKEVAHGYGHEPEGHNQN